MDFCEGELVLLWICFKGVTGLKADWGLGLKLPGLGAGIAGEPVEVMTLRGTGRLDWGTKPVAVEAKTGISGIPNSLSQMVTSSIMSACEVALIPEVPTAATGVVWEWDRIGMDAG